MKTWVVILADGMGMIKMEVCEEYNKALHIGGEMMKEEYADDDAGVACEGDEPSKFVIVDDYIPGIVGIFRKRDPEDFFPGEPEVRIYEKEIVK